MAMVGEGEKSDERSCPTAGRAVSNQNDVPATPRHPCHQIGMFTHRTRLSKGAGQEKNISIQLSFVSNIYNGAFKLYNVYGY